MPTAITWLRRIDENPEKFGITREHVNKVNRDIRNIEEHDARELDRLQKRADRMEAEGVE